jgi:hypothetical protein
LNSFSKEWSFGIADAGFDYYYNNFNASSRAIIVAANFTYYTTDNGFQLIFVKGSGKRMFVSLVARNLVPSFLSP